MSHSRLKTTLLASALALAGTANAATTLLSEGFDSVYTLASHGWVLTNNSSPGGTTGWFTGEDFLFPSQDGTGGYAAANFNNAAAGGTIDNWLITPQFSTANNGHVSLWLRGLANPDFPDTVKFGFSNGDSATSAFTTGTLVTATGDWTEYSFAYVAGGAGSMGRFAIEYTGSADVSNYIGVDTLSITAVPEPATWAMFAFGAAALVARRRRSAR
ncbi:MAG: choice-of-anchor J domain-containing protein [Pseudomonadota bacterium]|nr:choice-of-anchor J domain-containing protein [Pseudomonadota bacterium]